MTNDELKKMIMDVINATDISVELRRDDIIILSDALIAAGIVDKSDYASMKETAVRYKAEVSKAKGRAKEAEHRAARAEKAFSKLVHEMYEHGIRPMCDEKFFVESRLKDAEKELAEEGK